jgi:hypothetical protein
MMRTVFLYLLLSLIAYICQSVLYPLLLPSQLRVDLLLILVVHASFTHTVDRALMLGLFAGILSDMGMPPGLGFHPLFYPVVTLIASLLWQSLNLQARRYQGVFLGVCALSQGLGLWTIMTVQDSELAGTAHMFQILAWRTLVTAFVGPLILQGIGRLSHWFAAVMIPQEYQEG